MIIQRMVSSDLEAIWGEGIRFRLLLKVSLSLTALLGWSRRS